MIKKYLLFLFLTIGITTTAQDFTLSEAAEISVLTIGPGAQLYDKFGHSAFRIKDSQNGFDVVFNYGVYDFDTPNFYTKFAQGKLLYELGVSYYQPFYETYVRQNRWIKEQTLNLTFSEKQQLSDFLWNNSLPENKKYKYDFFYDNCATKIRDVLKEVLGEKLTYHDDHITEEYTFRELIAKNLNANSWGSLVIDVALGAVIDRKAKPIEYQFLPDYIYEGAENATVSRNNTEEKLVKKDVFLFENTKTEAARSFFLSPLFVFGVLGLLIIFITFKNYKNNTRNRLLDFLIFLVTGSIGFLLLFLWFATDHTATANNNNLFWAFPISLFFIFAIFRKNPKPWLASYAKLLFILLVFLLIHWVLGVQSFTIGLVPLFIALAVRYVFLSFRLKSVGSL